MDRGEGPFDGDDEGSDGSKSDNVEQAELGTVYLTKKMLADYLHMSEGTIDNRTNPESNWYDPEFPLPRITGIGRSAGLLWIRRKVDAYVESRPTR